MNIVLRVIGDTIGKILAKIRPQPIAQSVGDALIALIKKNFDQEVDPYGARWVPHSPRYWRYRGGRRVPKPYKIMHDTGTLLNSFVQYTTVENDTARSVVSNPTPYLQYHQEGRGNNPMRLIFPQQGNIPESWLTQSRMITLEYVNRQIRS